MSEDRRMYISRGAAAVTIAAMLAAGAGGTYLVMRERPPSPVHVNQSGAPAPSPPAPPAPAAAPAVAAGRPSLPDVVVGVSRDAADRAGIAVTQATAQGVSEQLRLPGAVEPNGYRQVAVTPLAGGRVVSVSAQLGDRVRRGQTLAQVYSPEVAEARTKYISAKAMLDAHDRELQRTQKLVEIGAASRQELERLHAEHAAQTSEVETARSRLRLLGADTDGKGKTDDSGATIEVRAPMDGVVTERLANTGVNVDAATRLFTVVDLSNVWIIANVYEKDLPRVRVGERATVTTQAAPEIALEGRVTYIDPQLDVSTRTAKVRIEVANPRGDLRLGMYADVGIASSTAAGVVVSVPKGAIQNVSDHQVVYLPMPNDDGKFLEREVRTGYTSGDLVQILSGVAAGDRVVSKGSFFLRAEVERLGLRAAAAPSDQAVQTARVTVTDKGFEPDSLKLRAGVPARITFVRTVDKTCATEVTFPGLKITRPLPLNQPVTIELTPAKEDITFTCGMNMLRGTVVASGSTSD